MIIWVKLRTIQKERIFLTEIRYLIFPKNLLKRFSPAAEWI